MNKDELEVSPPRPRPPLQRDPLNPNIKVPGAPAGGSILGDVLHSAYNGLTHVGHAVHGATDYLAGGARSLIKGFGHVIVHGFEPENPKTNPNEYRYTNITD